MFLQYNERMSEFQAGQNFGLNQNYSGSDMRQ